MSVQTKIQTFFWEGHNHAPPLCDFGALIFMPSALGLCSRWHPIW